MEEYSHHLALFAKYWQPGKVKTRLAAKLGEGSASKVYHAFLTELIERFQFFPAQKTIVYSPTDRHSEFVELAQNHWTLHPQAEGDLGNRLRAHCRTVFSTDENQKKLLIIGSDCVSISKGILQHAYKALDSNEVVLGPTYDGGYYLVGMSKLCPEIFDDIHWSTENVLSQTLQRISDNRLKVATLPKLNDVDELKDLVQLRDELAEQGSTSKMAAVIHRELAEQ